MEKLKMHTLDLTEENFKKLAELFPNAVTETKDENGEVVRAVDADVLRQEISTTVVEGPQERYQFTWPDKKKSEILAYQPITKTFRLDRQKSVGRDGTPGSIDTENIYIEGDNLDALKILQETYLGRVKMIYIDPPYNTGSNIFVYDDDGSISGEEFVARSGQRDEEGKQLYDMRENNESNGRFHTDWLNMMYPRLRVAKDLISDDGVIVVSIDYHEFENLKKILDEIFGKENFQREIIWRIGWISGYKTTAPNFIRNHDTMFVYSKNKEKLSFIKKYIENADFKELVKKEPKLTRKLESFGLTKEQQSDLLAFINHDNRPDKYPIEDTWNCNEYDDLNSIAIVSYSGEKISKILGIDQELKGQKSVKMLKRLLEAYTSDNDIILDFFSGTASTAHAAMQLNAEDSGHRKFIMVQLPEACKETSEAYKAGYQTICDLGEERIRRVGKKIRDDYARAASDLDIGFRVFYVDNSNMKDVYYRPRDYDQKQLELFADNIKPDRTPEDLLIQSMLDLGVPLSSKIDIMEIAGKQVFSVEDGLMIACFDSDISEELVTEIAKWKPQHMEHPQYALFRDGGIANDSVMANFDQIFETYSPKTERKIL